MQCGRFSPLCTIGSRWKLWCMPFLFKNVFTWSVYITNREYRHSLTLLWFYKLLNVAKGYMKWKIGLKETLLFERTFEVIKIGLYSCRVSHFSFEIFGFVWYVNNCTTYVTLHNDFFGNQEYHWGCRTKSLKTMHVYVSTSIKPANFLSDWITYLIS